MERTVVKRLVLLAVVLVAVVLAVQVAMAQPSYDVLEVIAVSSNTAGMTDDGVEYDPYDIIARETISYTEVSGQETDTYWYKLFDGEDYGLDSRHVINSIAVVTDEPVGIGCGLYCIDYILMSFLAQSVKVPGITPKVAGQDIVALAPVEAAQYDEGFTLVFDGSDVGLTEVTEKIDGLDYWEPAYVEAQDVVLPDDCTEGIFFISTQAEYRVPAAEGGSLVGTGSDVLLFCATQLGATTHGYWFRVHDEADYDLTPSNAISGIDADFVFENESNAVEDEPAQVGFTFITRMAFSGYDVAGGPNEVFYFPGCGDPGFYYGGPITNLSAYPALDGTASGYDLLTYYDD